MSKTTDGAGRKYCHECRIEQPSGSEFCSRCGKPVETTPPPPRESGLSGRAISNLLLEREVQRTGRGVLYRALDRAQNRHVLVRLFRPRRSLGRSVIDQMKREVQLARRLTHPNILQVQELAQTDDGWIYLVMEHLDADPLDVVLREIGTMEQELALAIVGQVLSALELAHSKGIVHRNLTPANILLSRTGTPDAWVKLTEFGLSKRAEEDPEVETTKLVENQLVRGTPWYIAPEALRGDETDHRVDLYAVGVMLFQMLTGVIPFEEADAARLAERVMYEAPPSLEHTRPNYPFLAGLDRVVRKAMVKQPRRRHATARELFEDLQAVRERGFDVGTLLVASVLTMLLTYALFGIRVELDADGDLRTRLWVPRTAESQREVLAVGALQLAMARAGVFEGVEVAPSAEAPRLSSVAPPTDYERYLGHARTVGGKRGREAITEGMELVPAGAFVRGTEEAGNDGEYHDALPEKTVVLGLFYIDRAEVTHGQYAEMIADLDRSVRGAAPYPVPESWSGRVPHPRQLDLPVTGVTWYDAALYAAWAGKRLPDESQWEKAARGAERRLYPWGEEFDPAKVCYRETSDGAPRAASELPDGASVYRVLCLAGNVREWTRDAYPGAQDHMTIRGGSFRSPAEHTRAYWRDAFRKDGRSDDLGFRCVYTPAGGD